MTFILASYGAECYRHSFQTFFFGPLNFLFGQLKIDNDFSGPIGPPRKKVSVEACLTVCIRAALRHKLGFKIFEKRAGWKNNNFEGKILIFEVLSTNLCFQRLAALPLCKLDVSLCTILSFEIITRLFRWQILFVISVCPWRLELPTFQRLKSADHPCNKHVSKNGCHKALWPVNHRSKAKHASAKNVGYYSMYENKVKLKVAFSEAFERSSCSDDKHTPRTEQYSIWKHLWTTIC